MRDVKYLSPTSIALWESDRENFYLSYLADHRPPKIPQTQPMSVGSAFDAFVKSELFYRLFGNWGEGDRFKFEAIFESQVEPHNRAWALDAGEHVFKAYEKSGALADLVLELKQATEDPRFEFKIEARVIHATNLGGVQLLGKPDLHFVSGEGNRVINDWKVNGYCGRHSVSPKPGYVNCRDGWNTKIIPPSRTSNKPHKNAQVMRIGDIDINAAVWLEDVDSTWARQLTIYAWVMGEPIGSNFIVGIDQIVSQGAAPSVKPFLRIHGLAQLVRGCRDYASGEVTNFNIR